MSIVRLKRTCCSRCFRICCCLVFVITMVVSLWAFVCGIFATAIFWSLLSLWFAICLIRAASILAARWISIWSTFFIATTVSIFSAVRNNWRKWCLIFGINYIFILIRVICFRVFAVGSGGGGGNGGSDTACGWLLCDGFLSKYKYIN